MLGLPTNNHVVFALGVLGNLISFAVYLAPIPTFIRVYRRGSTEGFQSFPYVVALFSSMLWIFYALMKTDAMLLISINAFGCIVESIYIIVYLIYATRRSKINTIKWLILLNVVTFGLIVMVINLVTKSHSKRVVILGWFCVGFSVCVFVAPLTVIGLVIRTRSVDYMPFYLSLSLTCSAIVWFFYGFISHDKYIAIPNVLGFFFGLIQMVLYGVYKNNSNTNTTNSVSQEQCQPEHIVTIARGQVAEVHPIDTNRDCELSNARDK